LLAHAWIKARANAMQAQGGRSDVIQKLAIECGPTVVQHYAERSREDDDDGGGDTLKVVPKKNHPIAPAKTRKQANERKSLTFLETGTMLEGDQRNGDFSDDQSGSPRPGGISPLDALDEADPPDFMKYFRRSDESPSGAPSAIQEEESESPLAS